jgi:plasmid stabilization system protein ParE
MPHEVIWLPEALEDARRLRQFLQDKNPSAAARAAETLDKGADLLASFPEMGRPMDDGSDRRELSMPFASGFYVLRYIYALDTVFIIRAWHNRENRI